VTALTPSGQITEQELQRLRARLGEVVTISEPPYLTQASFDAIRRWAMATGDRNPLYLDPVYASRSRFGGVIAPPCLPYAFSRLSIGYRGGLPGVHSMFGGSHWRWHAPMPAGTDVTPATRFTDLVELDGRFAGRTFKQMSLTTFSGPSGELYAEVQGWGLRTERQTARKKGKYAEVAFPSYTAGDLDAIAAEYRREVPRGPEPRLWQTVAVGDELPSIVRGPYTATTAVAFEQAWGGLFIKAHGFWFEFLDQHPAAGLANPYGIPEPPEAVHWDSALARSVGVPEAYDYGPERIAWLSTLLTNWAGDDGWLSELYVEVRRFNLIGDLTRCRGVVSELTPPGDDGYGTVRVRVAAVNQRGEETALGWAVVRLPSAEPA
jgi:acyl dehydratase